MSFDITEHKCVDKAKVNSLVRSLETMRNEKSDLKMAVYKQFDSIGEQFSDILYENSSGCNVNSSCCIIPIRSQLTQQILDDPDAMQRAEFALEGQDEMRNVREDIFYVTGAQDAHPHQTHNDFKHFMNAKQEEAIFGHDHSQFEEYVIARKEVDEEEICHGSNDSAVVESHCIEKYPPVLFDSTCDESGKSCENPLRGQPLRQIEDDPEEMKRAKYALYEADDSLEQKNNHKSSPLATSEMSVFGAIGGRVRHMCRNCDKNEVTNDRKSALCNECQQYQKQYNKPRPISIRENKCLYCCATIWIEGRCDEVLYCDKCKHKVLSTSAKEIPSTEYDTRRDDYKNLRLSAIKETDLASKKTMELEPMATRSDAKDSHSIQTKRPMEMELAAKKNEDFLQLEPISKKVMDFQPITKKKDPMDLQQISKTKDSFFVKEWEIVSKKKDSNETVSTKTKTPLQPILKDSKEKFVHEAPEMNEFQPITKRAEAKETLAIKVKEPLVVEPATKKKTGFESISVTVKESMELEPMKSAKGSFSSSVPTYRRSSSRTLSVDYGGEQCFDYCEWGDIRPFGKKKSRNDCVSNNQSEDRFSLRGVIKNQSYDQTEQAREGCSSGSGIREPRMSEENLLTAKRSSDSVTSCGAEISGSEIDVSFGGFDSSPFKRDDSSAEPEYNSVPVKWTSSTSVVRKSVTEREASGVEEIEGFGKAEMLREKEETEYKCNRDINSKDRYCFEDLEAYPLLTDKVSKSEI